MLQHVSVTVRLQDVSVTTKGFKTLLPQSSYKMLLPQIHKVAHATRKPCNHIARQRNQAARPMPQQGLAITLCGRRPLKRCRCKRNVTRCYVTMKLQDASVTMKYVTRCFCHIVVERSMLQDVSVTMRYVTRRSCHSEVTRCPRHAEVCYKSFLPQRRRVKYVSRRLRHNKVCYNMLLSQ